MNKEARIQQSLGCAEAGEILINLTRIARIGEVWRWN